MKAARLGICGVMLLAGAALCVALLLSDVPGASAATPTPTATPILAIPTSMYSTTAPMTAELDAGFWDYDQYQATMSAAWSWYDVANRYHIIQLFAVFTIASIVVAFIGKIILAKAKAK